ncbi:MAG: DUF4352 domain-containing protein [Bulleidia sp.]
MRKAVITVLASLLVLSGCSAAEEGAAAAAAESTAEAQKEVTSASGYGQGEIGDLIHTSFFDWTVNDAWQTDEYEGITPSAGHSLLVVSMTLTDTRTDESVPMYDSDFQVQWGGTEDTDFAVPVTYESSIEGGETMFAAQYTLEPGTSVTNQLVFEVPSGYTDFSMLFQEYFSDESLGDLFCVKFSAVYR